MSAKWRQPKKRVWEAPVGCFVLPMQLQSIEVSKRKYYIEMKIKVIHEL